MSTHARASTPDRGAPVVSRSLLAGLLLGVGTAAFLDETVFHQLLHWHHFYDKSTLEVGLVSDGLFHAFGWFSGVAGLFLLGDARARREFVLRRWAGGVLLGAGAFQLYDGTIQHKLMRLHQIRYGVDLTPYDWTWDVVAVLLLVLGALLALRGRRGPTDIRA